MPTAYKSILDYFKVVSENPSYEAQPQNFSTTGVTGEETAHEGTAQK